jgi:hypothetical protein
MVPYLLRANTNTQNRIVGGVSDADLTLHHNPLCFLHCVNRFSIRAGSIERFLPALVPPFILK